MEADKTVRNALLDTVLEQIDNNDPPATRLTYERLVAAGQSQSQALNHIAAVLRQEMNRMLEDSTPFDDGRFAAALASIPSEG